MALVNQAVKKFDISYGHTDAKEAQNLATTTGNGLIKGIIVHEESAVNFASAADGVGETIAITVIGVALGDVVMGVSLGVDIVDTVVTAYVQAADSVEVRLQNESTSTADLASTTVRLVIADMT